MMKRLGMVATLLLAGALTAQQPIDDPANLMGERVSPQDPADTLPINHGAAALQQLLLKLRTRASLMLIVAHPDDEDGGMLTYESRGQGARVAMLTLTRGEGGQNLMSADFDDALGLIRTQELLAADRYMGVDQMFGTEVDFGFSKTKEESFAKWTHERVLYDAVRAVRLYRPLVIASVFVGGPTDGHGQHQVSGEIAQEVFLAAADPKVFPEMGLPVWAPLKVYARVPFSRVTAEGMYDYATGKTVPTRFHNYVTGKDSTEVPTATVLIHEGDPALVDGKPALGMEGLSYVQFARKGLALQKTQIGPNVRLAPPGRSDTGYTLMGSRLPAQPGSEQSVFEGVDTSLAGIADLAPAAPASIRISLEAVARQILRAQSLFDPVHLEASAPPLTEALNGVTDAINKVSLGVFPLSQKEKVLHELRVKHVQLNQAVILATQVESAAVLDKPNQLLVDSTPVVVSLRVRNNGPGIIYDLGKTSLQVVGAGVSMFKTHTGELSLASHETRELEQTLVPQTSLPATRPYFSRPNSEQPFYNVADPALRNAPTTPYPVRASVIASVGQIRTASFLQMTLSPPVLDSLLPRKPVVIIPPVGVSISPSIGILRKGKQSFTLAVTLTDHSQDDQEGMLKLELPAGWQTTPKVASWKISAKNPSAILSFVITTSPTVSAVMNHISAIATSGSHDYTEAFRPVGYTGLPYTNFYTPATYRSTAVDVATAPNLQVGYLAGTGDMVPDFLPSLGIRPTVLSLDELKTAKLAGLDAVVLGVRAYAAHPELEGAGSQVLLDYAKGGGVVIVQYNTARYGTAEAPFPITVPGDPAHNVVEEAQRVRILVPDAPLLNWPNKITAADFDGWVAERGHGFASDWDPGYTALTETHDEGQDPQRGGLLYAKTGKGAYVYLAYALYRQLPEGVPGAYRLMANLLSLGKNPALAK